VGNGPYRYVRHDPETMMEFRANPDYYLGKPSIERVVMKNGGSSPIHELLSGNVDIAWMDSLIAEKVAARDDRFRVYYRLAMGPIRIVWNVRNLLFRDKMIRRALTMAIDRRSLLGIFNLPADLPITEGPYTSCMYERRQLKAPWPHDPDEAKRILEDTGWRDENGDGIRERNGRPFHFVAIVAPRWEKAAVFVQDQLLRIGIKMEVQMLSSWGLMEQRFAAGDFDAAIPRLPNTDQRIGEFSQNGYKNSRVIELMGALKETVDLDASHRIYAELSEIFHDEIPGTFLFPRSSCRVAHRRIRGFARLSMNFLGMERLWIEEEKE
jgi:peptide/nickel transport system substrate-binding protein